MRSLPVLAITIALVSGLAVSAKASIQVTASGPGIFSLYYEGDVKFPQVNYVGPGTIIHKELYGLTPFVLDVTYDQSDLDFVDAYGSGFRWAEMITNMGTVPWTDYHISLTDTTGTFSGKGNFLNTGIGASEVPGMASIDIYTYPPEITVLSNLGVADASGNIMTLSADQREMTIVFGTALAPGESFGVHIPIENLGDGPGAFSLSQNPTVIPEPASLIAWSVLGLIAYACAFWRRRRCAVPA